MANDCLVTKLKSVVNNDNLKTLGTIIIPILGSENRRSVSRIGGSSTKPIFLSLPNGTIYNGGSDTPWEQPVSKTSTRYIDLVCTSDSKLYIADKYNLVELTIAKYSGSAGTLNGLIPADFYFDLGDFEYCEDLVTLSLGSSDVSGDISILKKCIKIVDLAVGYGNFTGDLVTLVKLWINNGRDTTGSINFYYTYYNTIYSGVVKFNGHTIPMDAVNALGQLSWESSTKMALLISGNHNVLCVGYSNEEIATKTASGGDWAGYTVTKCD